MQQCSGLSRLFPMAVLAFSAPALVAQTYTGTGSAIPDDGTSIEIPVVVNGAQTATLSPAFGLLRACLDITHPYCSDLSVSLVAPSGMVIDLISSVGVDGDNFTNTCLEDGAGVSVTLGTAPFNGTYRAMSPLGDANNGGPGNGTWYLRVRDTYPFADEGTLNAWSITFGNGAPAPFALPSSNLPIVLLDTDGQPIPDDPKIPGTIKIIHYPPGLNHPTDQPNVFDGLMAIEQRGHFSSSLPQKPYSLELRNDLGQDVDAELLGMPEESDWLLIADYNDKSLVRNPLAFRMFRDMGHWAPRTQLCEVMLNGSYRGIYALTEKIKRDGGRVDIAKLDPDENTGDDVTGGYIFKVDYWTDTTSWQSDFSPIDHPGLDVHFVYEYPDAETITDEQKAYIQGFVNGFETALYAEDFDDPLTGYRAWMDTRSFIDYFLVNEVARNVDGFKKSRFFHKDKDSNGGALKAGPLWDFDWAWKNVLDCETFSATDGSGWSYLINDCNPDNHSPGWMVRLFEDSSFANELHCRYRELRATTLSIPYLNAYIDSVHALVDQGAQQRHFLRWPVLGVNAGTPEVWPLAMTYPEELQRMKDWIALRLAWLDANMPGACTITNVGVGSITAPVVRLFPNPAQDVLFVEGDRAMQGCAVLDAAGRAVLEDPSNGRFATRLSLDALASGTYLLRIVYTDGSTATQRFAVQ